MFLQLKGATQEQIQLSLVFFRKVLKERESNFERSMNPRPAYGAAINILIGYKLTVQYQFPWPYNPFDQTYIPKEATRASASGPLLVHEASQFKNKDQLENGIKNHRSIQTKSKIEYAMYPTRRISANT